MAVVHCAIVIKASPDAVWAVVRDFQNTDPWLSVVRTTAVGEKRRKVVRPDGGFVYEELQRLDDRARHLAYDIVDSDVPFTDHHAHLCVVASTDPRCALVEWYADATPTGMSMADMVALGEDNYRNGLLCLKTFIESR